MKCGLRTKLLVPLVGVVLCSMVAAGHFSAQTAARDLWNGLENSSRHIAEGLSRSLAMFVQGVTRTLAVEAGNERIVRALKEVTPEKLQAVGQDLNDLVALSGSVQTVTLVDRGGKALAGSDGAMWEDLGDKEAFQQALEGKTALSRPFVSRRTGGAACAAATPVMAGGVVLGVLYALVDLDRFAQDMVDTVTVGHHGYAFVADASGVVFCHPDRNLEFKENLAETDWGRKVLATTRGLVRYEHQGRELTAVSVKDAATGWTCVVKIDDEDIVRSAGAVRNAGLAAGLAGLAGVCAVVALVGGRLSARLNRCARYTENAAAGNLEGKLDVPQGDECGRLALALHALAATLKMKNAEFKRLSEEAGLQAELARQSAALAQKAKALAESRTAGMLEATRRLRQVMAVITTATNDLSSRIERAHPEAWRRGGQAGGGSAAAHVEPACSPKTAETAGCAATGAVCAVARTQAATANAVASVRGAAQSRPERAREVDDDPLFELPLCGLAGPRAAARDAEGRTEGTPAGISPKAAADMERALRAVADLASRAQTIKILMEHMSADEDDILPPGKHTRLS